MISLKHDITIPFDRSPFFLAAVCVVLGNLLLGKSKRMRERNELTDAATAVTVAARSWDSVVTARVIDFTIHSPRSRSVMLTLTVNATQ